METATRQPIELVEITLRDGEQQEIAPVTIEERIAVFDELVATGCKIFEIGHLGNTGRNGRYQGDQEFASRLIKHINKKSDIDPRYNDLKLQVLFGSQEKIIGEALECLDGFDKDRIVVHVYDRLDDHLRSLASQTYSVEESAKRVCNAADIAFDKGYRHFSISGEGATGLSVEQAVTYYSSIGEHLQGRRAKSINFNLANTYGTPPEVEWDIEGLRYFNDATKESVPIATTSVHVHNDDGSAVEFSIAAIKAGFDKVEGTLIGMGERNGNTALCDIVVRLFEIARLEIEQQARPTSTVAVGSVACRKLLFDARCIPGSIMESLDRWYESCVNLATIYQVENNTSFGHPSAYKAGSGPHDHASLRATQDPVEHPLWKNYLRIALPHAAMGRPEAQGIIRAEPEVIRDITVNGRTGGNSTDKIIGSGYDSTALSAERDKAASMARAEIDKIRARMAA